MNYKIVADSSSNILSLDQANFTSVPLHILVGEHEFVDDEQIDLVSMQNALSSHKGKSSTSCPSPGDWEAAFEDAETVFCVTITSELPDRMHLPTPQNNYTKNNIQIAKYISLILYQPDRRWY